MMTGRSASAEELSAFSSEKRDLTKSLTIRLSPGLYELLSAVDRARSETISHFAREKLVRATLNARHEMRRKGLWPVP